ncbi:hypothetical protein DL764_008018 [Monosporascus ibericus]|uniref:Zn(2)-C6 fungal-type domain-containing protein n=1 Tax=Monosporascus ibericus TaxID=155417 RepID=A0A4Q4T0Q5_9PEZI|nr:hypothetical protein DL764_008018 [Monosporascus ibericus]
MAEAHHEQQPQARSQPEPAGAASDSAFAIVPTSTPAPEPDPGPASADPAAAAEGPAHALPRPPSPQAISSSPLQSQDIDEGRKEETEGAQAGSHSVVDASADVQQAQPGSESASELEATAPAQSTDAGIAAAHEQALREQQVNEDNDKVDQSSANASLQVPTTVTTLAAGSSSIPAQTATTITTAKEVSSVGQAQQQNGHLSTSSPPSPAATAMSNHPPQPPGPPRQQHQQPPPAMNYAPQPTWQPAGLYGYHGAPSQGSDAYRASPRVTNGAMSLPSMRTFDPVQQTQQQHQQPQHSHVAMTIPHAVASVPGNIGDQAANENGLPYMPQKAYKAGCDETHPVCKNCQKSKRECLGYDPIFKQQQHPSNIQPAPNHTSASPVSSTPALSNGPANSSGTISAGAAAYANLPSVLPNASTTATNNASLISPQHTSSIPKGGAGYRGTVDPLLASTSTSIGKMTVDELVNMGGATPPPLDSPLSADKLNEVRDLYEQVYAVGLEAFFETKWYMSPQGLNALVSHTGVNEMMAGFLQSMAKTDANDVAGMQYSANLEFRVVWDLATLVNASEVKVNIGDTLPPPDDGSEARNRVCVFGALLSGDYLDQNPLTPAPAQGDYHRIREFRFWYYLAEFLRIKDHDVDMTAHRERILGLVRELLDGRENRDVLYSFAIIRTLAPKFPPDFESTLPPHLDESDPKSKLAVARKFIQDESQVTGGTTNVVRRFSELAVRAFILPGGNIQRVQE